MKNQINPQIRLRIVHADDLFEYLLKESPVKLIKLWDFTNKEYQDLVYEVTADGGVDTMSGEKLVQTWHLLLAVTAALRYHGSWDSISGFPNKKFVSVN